jgi:two-component system response regulator DesR
MSGTPVAGRSGGPVAARSGVPVAGAAPGDADAYATDGPEHPRIRLLLADDQSLVRGALAALLNLEPDLQVVAEVGRGDQVVDAARASHADVALLDVEMPGIDGIAAAAALAVAVPECRSLIVTTFGRPGFLRRAMEAGASGFVVKDTPSEQLAAAVRRVASGFRVVDPVLAAESLASGVSPLTARETEVLRVAASGATIGEMARELHLSEGTVRNHLSSAIRKTGARNRSDAVRAASSQGWLL